MAKGTRISEFEKGEITAQKRVGKYQREIFESRMDAVKLLSAITWKVQISLEQENQLATQKDYHHNSREELFAK